MPKSPGLAMLLALIVVPALAPALAPAQAQAQAQAPAPLPSPAVLADHNAKRFPQPVRVGDLVGRDVLQPQESQPVLGRVQSLSRRADGGVDIVIRAGTTLGMGGRPVAVPIEAVALLGEHVALIDYTPAQLDGLPTAQPGSPIAATETIKVGLVKPFH